MSFSSTLSVTDLSLSVSVSRHHPSPSPLSTLCPRAPRLRPQCGCRAHPGQVPGVSPRLHLPGAPGRAPAGPGRLQRALPEQPPRCLQGGRTGPRPRPQRRRVQGVLRDGVSLVHMSRRPWAPGPRPPVSRGSRGWAPRRGDVSAAHRPRPEPGRRRGRPWARGHRLPLGLLQRLRVPQGAPEPRPGPGGACAVASSAC